MSMNLKCGNSGMTGGGKVWERYYYTNSVTSEKMLYMEGYKSYNPTTITQKYWRYTVGPVEHVTVHRDGNVNTHWRSGSVTYSSNYYQ